jgi:hypothetical protein
MISGESAVTPVETILASGVMPSCRARTSLITTTAAAPSLSGQQLPAVIRPSGRNTGFSVATPSIVTPGRGPSSVDTTPPSGVVTGVISRAQKPSAMAFSARFWLRTPNSSMSCLLTSLSCARFSAVCPMARYTSGSSPPDRGSTQLGAPPADRRTDRSRAPSNRGFCQPPPTSSCASAGSPSELPRASRETHSTPAETNTSPSPARMAWKAIRVVCRDDAQYRVSVAAGRPSSPSMVATTLAMLKPCSPPGRPQPRYRSSMVVGSSCGTLSRAARTTVVARSSGRRSRSEPLTARPMGERAVATTTASGMNQR